MAQYNFRLSLAHPCSLDRAFAVCNTICETRGSLDAFKQMLLEGSIQPKGTIMSHEIMDFECSKESTQRIEQINFRILDIKIFNHFQYYLKFY